MQHILAMSGNRFLYPSEVADELPSRPTFIWSREHSHKRLMRILGDNGSIIMLENGNNVVYMKNDGDFVVFSFTTWPEILLHKLYGANIEGEARREIIKTHCMFDKAGLVHRQLANHAIGNARVMQDTREVVVRPQEEVVVQPQAREVFVQPRVQYVRGSDYTVYALLFCVFVFCAGVCYMAVSVTGKFNSFKEDMDGRWATHAAGQGQMKEDISKIWNELRNIPRTNLPQIDGPRRDHEVSPPPTNSWVGEWTYQGIFCSLCATAIIVVISAQIVDQMNNGYADN
jgi:hypothetical protein